MWNKIKKFYYPILKEGDRVYLHHASGTSVGYIIYVHDNGYYRFQGEFSSSSSSFPRDQFSKYNPFFPSYNGGVIITFLLLCAGYILYYKLK